MTSKQLKCSDLAAGDILLQASSGSLASRVITLGQSLFGGPNASVVHAGVMFDKTFLIEAVGSGVSANDLRTGGAKLAYTVFRARNQRLGQGAGTFAKILFDVHGRSRTVGYSALGAVGSLGSAAGKPKSRTEMDGVIDGILSGRSHPHFCSQLVVMVYQFVAEQNGMAANTIFPFADGRVSPSELATYLSRAPGFLELGHLLPGQR
jgi:hypothetical protein